MSFSMIITALTLFSFTFASLHQQWADRGPPKKAIAVLSSETNQVNGVIYFKQIQGTNVQNRHSSFICIYGNVTGLSRGNHGFHIHQYGDLSNGCTSAGPHYNPNQYDHGAPTDSIRHVGDLGNIRADYDGITRINTTDHELKLMGTHSIIGRAVVVHEHQDDLGTGVGEKMTESKKTGNAGARIACGVIGILG